MNKVFYIILISLFSLTIISCSSSSDGGSKSTDNTTTTTDNTTTTTDNTTGSSQTFVDSNFCRITKNTSRSNSSLIVNDRRSDSRSSGRTGRVMYVDKSSQSKYKTDNYLLLDQFDIDSVYVGGMDAVDLSGAAPTLGSQFTLEARFYYDDGGYGSGQLLGSESFRAPSIGFLNHGKEIRYGFGTDGAVKYPGRSTNLNTLKAWHHVATTFDGTNYKLFLDGVEIDNTTAFQGLTPPEPVTMIGSNIRRKKNPWIGKVDEVRIWNDARTQTDIQLYMNETLVGNETGLVAYYPMDVNNNWEIIDKSPNANHAKITNAEILSRYFSSDCPNGPDGSTTCPYPTIRSSLDNVTSGDHVYIRQGRYTELLNKRPLNVDLTKGVNIGDAFLKEEEKIIIEGYPNEEVIIDGTVALNENSSNWQPYPHQLDNGTTINIYKTVINFDNITREIMKPVDNITQVFVNGRYMIPAMPMNFKNPTDPTTGNPRNPEPGTVWAGIGRTPFRYPADDNSSWGPESPWGFDWYMPGKLENLDNPEEWAFDPANKTLYLYASDNYTPTSTNVRVRVRDRLMNFRAAYNFEFKNIHFFAGSIKIDASSYWTIEDSKFSFSSDMGLKGNGSVYGNKMTFRNSIFEFINDNSPWKTWKSMYPTFENVLFRYNDWFAGSAMYAITDRNYRNVKTSPNFERGDSHWRFVTIENSFTAGIFAGYGSLVEYTRT